MIEVKNNNPADKSKHLKWQKITANPAIFKLRFLTRLFTISDGWTAVLDSTKTFAAIIFSFRPANEGFIASVPGRRGRS